MSEGINVKNIFLKFIKEDLRIIATFLFVILFITYGFALFMGYLSLASGTATIRTPSVGFQERNSLPDQDGDTLPDVIEGTPAHPCQRGDTVVLNGQTIGTCTGTNYRDIDTDGDLFTDNIEDTLGTSPTSPLNPGWIYIVVLAYVITFLAIRYYTPDPLKEYKEFEMKASSGVSGAEGKYAYGGKSVFGEKSAQNVSEEDRKKAIQSDVRFQKMTSEKQTQPEKLKKKRNWGALAIQFSIAVLIGIFIFIAARLA